MRRPPPSTAPEAAASPTRCRKALRALTLFSPSSSQAATALPTRLTRANAMTSGPFTDDGWSNLPTAAYTITADTAIRATALISATSTSQRP